MPGIGKCEKHGVGQAASTTLGRLVVSVQSMPSICWLPLAILWFELSEKAILFAVVIGSNAFHLHKPGIGFEERGENLQHGRAQSWRARSAFVLVLIPIAVMAVIAETGRHGGTCAFDSSQRKKALVHKSRNLIEINYAIEPN